MAMEKHREIKPGTSGLSKTVKDIDLDSIFEDVYSTASGYSSLNGYIEPIYFRFIFISRIFG